MKRKLALLLAVLFLAALGCTKEPADQKLKNQPTADPKPLSGESEALDAFLEDAFERDLKVFQAPQPTYAADDPDRTLKECIDGYLLSRNRILSDLHQPFSTTEAVSSMLSFCDPAFRTEAKLTMWYRFYLRKCKMRERQLDLSYARYEHRTVYSQIVHDGDEATVTVQDAIQFLHVGSDVISSSGDTHTIRAKRDGDTWKIVYDDPGDLERHITDGYRRFLSECPYDDPDEIERYIKERFATWGPDEQPPIDITEEP